jgi:hypothetical protein
MNALGIIGITVGSFKKTFQNLGGVPLKIPAPPAMALAKFGLGLSVLMWIVMVVIYVNRVVQTMA